MATDDEVSTIHRIPAVSDGQRIYWEQCGALGAGLYRRHFDSARL